MAVTCLPFGNGCGLMEIPGWIGIKVDVPMEAETRAIPERKMRENWRGRESEWMVSRVGQIKGREGRSAEKEVAFELGRNFLM